MFIVSRNISRDFFNSGAAEIKHAILTSLYDSEIISNPLKPGNIVCTRQPKVEPVIDFCRNRSAISRPDKRTANPYSSRIIYSNPICLSRSSFIFEE
jgi:hypothetical protein